MTTLLETKFNWLKYTMSYELFPLTTVPSPHPYTNPQPSALVVSAVRGALSMVGSALLHVISITNKLIFLQKCYMKVWYCYTGIGPNWPVVYLINDTEGYMHAVVFTMVSMETSTITLNEQLCRIEMIPHAYT